MTVYRSKVDTWVYLALLFLALVAAFVLVGLTHADRRFVDYVGGAILIAASLWTGWLLFSTTYTIDDETLVVRSGPFRWIVPLDTIREVRPTRSLLAAPALSLDRLEVVYEDGRSVVVSPEDRDGFLAALSPR